MDNDTLDVDLSDAPRQREYLSLLPCTSKEAAEAMDVSTNTVKSFRESLRNTHDVEFEYDYSTKVHSLATPVTIQTEQTAQTKQASQTPQASGGSERPDLNLDRVDAADSEPDPEDLTDRERVIVHELQTGATLDELSERVDDRESVVTQHLRDLRREGWPVYIDEAAGHIAIEGEHVLRSSEHKGTRTRKANRWWELRHNELVREFRGLQTPSARLAAHSGHEDWVIHLTDLHAGDRVRTDDGSVVYQTEDIPDVIDYVTQQSLDLAEKHNSTYDAVHVLWGGDFVTNEGIYEGQFEDLDAWLDEQHDTLVAPLLRQLKALSREFPSVHVVTMVGNHGQHRASGTSRQANADLILYKHLRNTVAQLQEHGDALQNVDFRIGQAEAYRNFPLRGGDLTGHLRHGQHRKPQAETSARRKEWLGTLLDHDFDVAAMGHHHVSGRIPWDGPPVICTASPKPAGEFVETLGGRTPSEFQDVATAFGVSNDGLTAVYPIDTRKFDA